jgi:replicative DNA helicase
MSFTQPFIPSNTEAEAGVLSCLLFNPKLITRIIDTLKPEHFHVDNYGTVYQAICNLYQRNKACTLPNVRYELSRMERTVEEGNFSLDDLTGSLATLYSIEDYADTLIELSRNRQALSVASELADDAYHQRPGALDKAVERLTAIALGTDTKPVATLNDAVDRYMEVYNERRENFAKGIKPGIPTGFRDLDRLLRNLRASKLYVLAARPSLGKTALSLSMALEMDEEELVQRLLSMDTQIDQAYLGDGDTSDEQDASIRERAAYLKQLDLKMDDRTYLLNEICHKARKAHREQKLDLIVVDYLQLIDSSPEGRGRYEMRSEEVGKLTKGLKKLARELKVPVLALAQLNRESEKVLMPQLSHLGESAKIEQDSDVVMFINCEEVELEKRNNSEPYRLQVLVRKQRNGRVGTVSLMFRPRLTKFETEAPEYYDESKY